MQPRRLVAFALMALVLALSACAPAKTDGELMDKPTEAMMDKPTEAMMDETATAEAMMDETATPEAMMDEAGTPEAMMDETGTPEAMMDETGTPEAMMEAPAWFGATLTNVNTGQTFTINDFKGKVVLVETMAQWCSTCKQQENEVKSLHATMKATPDLVTVALDIDPNENADTLKSFAASNGFDWLYAVPSKEVAREIGNLYGAQFLNPPSAPMLIIDRKGEAHPLPFGIKSAADLMKALEPFLNEAM